MPILKKNISICIFSLLLLFPMFSDRGLGQTPIKVGALIPFTDRWGESGRECAKGMLDAGKWLNQRGGIYGRKLDILVIDDNSQVTEMMAAYRKFNEADRTIFFYLYSIDSAEALMPHIQFYRTPTFVSCLPAHLANPSKYPYVFSITPTIQDLAKIGMKFLSENSGIKVRKPKIVFIGSSDPLGKSFLEETKEYASRIGLDLGPDLWISNVSSSESLSFSLSALSKYNPDFAYLSLTSREASLLLQEAQAKNLKMKWIGNPRAFDENLIAFEGVYGVQPVSPFGEDIPGMVDIKEVHRRWHPHDSHTLSYVEGWATVQVMAEAIGRSLPEQMLSRERVKGALEGFKDHVLGGLVPPLTITAKDHRPSVESRIFMVKNGKLSRYTGFISVGR
jgi:branched-chain amino acid transport system substrate-binding protein